MALLRWFPFHSILYLQYLKLMYPHPSGLSVFIILQWNFQHGFCSHSDKISAFSITYSLNINLQNAARTDSFHHSIIIIQRQPTQIRLPSRCFTYFNVNSRLNMAATWGFARFLLSLGVKYLIHFPASKWRLVLVFSIHLRRVVVLEVRISKHVFFYLPIREIILRT